MKTLILISGETRAAQVCWPSVEEHVLKPLGTDYVIRGVVAFDQQAAFWQSIENADIKLVEQPNLDEKNYCHFIGKKPSASVQGILRQMWFLKQAWDMAEHEGLTETCENVIRLRPDLLFCNSIPEPDKWEDAVYIPFWGNYSHYEGSPFTGGYNDRFAFGPTVHMEHYFSMFDRLDDYLESEHKTFDPETADSVYLPRGIFHPETMLYWSLRENDVPVERTNVMFRTVRADGNSRMPEYNPGYGDRPFIE